MHQHPTCHVDGAGEDAHEQRPHGDEGQREVLPHDAERAPGELDRLGQHAQVVAHQRHRGRLEGDTRAGRAHRDADVGLRERRGVVHAVPHHRDDATGRLQPGDVLELVVGQEPAVRVSLVDAELGGDPAHAHRLVAAQEHGP